MEWNNLHIVIPDRSYSCFYCNLFIAKKVYYAIGRVVFMRFNINSKHGTYVILIHEPCFMTSIS